jgi:hypothetical protein
MSNIDNISQNIANSIDSSSIGTKKSGEGVKSSDVNNVSKNDISNIASEKENSGLQSLLQDRSAKEIIDSNKAKIEQNFSVNNTTFTIFVCEGKFICRTTNSDTGEVSYYPSLDKFSFAEPVLPNKGIFFEEVI